MKTMKDTMTVIAATAAGSIQQSETESIVVSALSALLIVLGRMLTSWLVAKSKK